MAQARSLALRRGWYHGFANGVDWALTSFASSLSLTVDDDIEKIIREGEERTAELNKKYEGMNLDALTNFQPELGTRSWEGTTYTGFKSGGPGWIDLGKRQANKDVSYAVDQYFSNAMKGGGQQPPKDDRPKVPKAPKQIDLQAHQFYPIRLAELQEQEMDFYRKENNLPAERPELKDGLTNEKVDKLQGEAQARIDAANPLTEAEREEKVELAEQVFTNWNKPEVRKFCELSGRYGRKAYGAIAAEMDNKTEDDIEAYADIFWARYKEISGKFLSSQSVAIMRD
jgi:SWI/SNF-related matrix-associated actin-dependent regulator of chromatin subfamily A member 5